MALAIIISLETPLSDAQAAYGKGETGKALAREIDKLDFAAKVKSVPAITSLLSESTEKLAEQMRAEGFDPAKMRLPPEKWFAPADGLKTLRALVEYVSEKLNDFKQPNPILKGLRAAEALLIAAEEAGIRFHFTKVDV